VSKRLRESDLIRKAYAALMQTMDNTNVQEDKDVEISLMQPMSDNEDVEEEGFEDIDSKLIGRPLFVVNLDPEPNQECLADKRIKARKTILF